MARRTEVNTADGFTMSADAYRRMTATMFELAMRGSTQEGIVMRIAKAGEIKDVTKQLTTLRTYAKKQGLVRAPRPPKDAGKGKRKRKGAGGSATDGAGQDA